MTEQHIFEKVQDAISQSCGIALDKIKRNSTLFNELGITSIDIVDILYTLESDFSVTLTVSDMECEIRAEMNGVPYEIDNVITPEGLAALMRRLPEIPSDKLKTGLTIHEVFNFFTVESLCKMIIDKINRNDLQNGKN